MKKVLFPIIGVFLLGWIAFLVFRAKVTPAQEGYFLSTEKESDDRVKSLNFDKPTEDASYILDAKKLIIPPHESKGEFVAYQADPEREWIIILRQVNGGPFIKSDLLKLFDHEWQSQFESEIYGFSSQEKKWTYPLADGSPDKYDQIQIGVNLQVVFGEEDPIYDQKKLARYISELEKRISKYPTQLKLRQTETIDDAIAKGKKLVELHNEFDKEAVIVLQSKTEFKGMEAWDALSSLGLKWGDGDLFHWDNNLDFGSNEHFSVTTTTEPNYFLPEQVKSGQMNPENLVFAFSIPRSADPKNVFDIMIASVKYAQKRLGGTLLNTELEPFNEDNEKKELDEVIKKMKARGIITGSDKALLMYN